LKNHLLKSLRVLGVDRAIGYSLVNRVWSMGSGVATLLMIGHFLSADERGFYYVFNNILGLQVLLELGLSSVILQFASHEKAHLKWGKDNVLEGDAKAKSRLALLLRFSLVWYGAIAVLLFVGVLSFGTFFFRSHQPPHSHIVWLWPWVLVVLSSACAMATMPIYCILNGCGLVKEIMATQVRQNIVGTVLFWLALWLDARLFAAPIMSVVASLWGAVWVARYHRHWLIDLLSVARCASSKETPSGESILNWRAEIWPLQWKIGLSWLSSYFIFQLFNPVLLAFYGAAAAGRMGMSLSVVFALAALGWAWVDTKIPSFGSLIARREFKDLDEAFFPCLWQSFGIVVTGSVGFWLVDYALYRAGYSWGHRLIEPLPLGILLLATCINHIYFAEATYLRAHKEEPYLFTSLVGGALIGLSTYFLGRAFGALGMAAGYLAVSALFWLPVGTWIFIKKRQLWHSPEWLLAR